jgi:hypothetical protein
VVQLFTPACFACLRTLSVLQRFAVHFGLPFCQRPTLVGGVGVSYPGWYRARLPLPVSGQSVTNKQTGPLGATGRAAGQTRDEAVSPGASPGRVPPRGTARPPAHPRWSAEAEPRVQPVLVKVLGGWWTCDCGAHRPRGDQGLGRAGWTYDSVFLPSSPFVTVPSSSTRRSSTRGKPLTA